MGELCIFCWDPDWIKWRSFQRTWEQHQHRGKWSWEITQLPKPTRDVIPASTLAHLPHSNNYRIMLILLPNTFYMYPFPSRPTVWDIFQVPARRIPDQNSLPQMAKFSTLWTLIYGLALGLWFAWPGSKGWAEPLRFCLRNWNQVAQREESSWSWSLNVEVQGASGWRLPFGHTQGEVTGKQKPSITQEMH